MINPWFKFYGGEYLADLKMLQLNGNERSCWLTLLCLANQADGGEIKLLSESQLFVLSGVKKAIPNLLQKFEKLGLVTICNGNVTVNNWEKRQYSEGYLRVKSFRKRESNGKDNDREEKSREEEIRIEESIDTSTPKQDTIKFFEMVNGNSVAYINFLDSFSEKIGITQAIAGREIKKFTDYWCELSASGKKARWEMEKTFEVQRRLAKWFSNASQWSKEKQSSKAKTIII